MRTRRLIVFSLLALWLSAPSASEILVVVNPDNPVDTLTRDQVVDLYMGRRTNFPDGVPALPIDLDADSPLRAAYYQRLVGKTVAQVNAYWARLLFTGRMTPPRILPDQAAVIDVVHENRGAIGYIDSQDLDGRVKVVFQLP